eukprot:TRINITY_DN32303_c0_g1_i1.p1 TRINITY_DN32303_c0_g1~~TRINITY_DN32303_c0_g1_i1.p1  ORF type:complete len:112 (+),score=1.33 TRINITY_DN32303_c0_g1_i1:175-510(+)
MKKVHAKIMMSKINTFKQDNAKFVGWLSSIALQEYYKTFENHAILTFEAFYFYIQSKSDLMHILGDRNAFDVDLLWKSCPKYQRQNSLSSLEIDGSIETGSNKQVEGMNNR